MQATEWNALNWGGLQLLELQKAHGEYLITSNGLRFVLHLLKQHENALSSAVAPWYSRM
jgi:hypothetical protein